MTNLKFATQTENHLQQILNYIKNNYDNAPFKSTRITQWMTSQGINNALFYYLTCSGALEKIKPSTYVLAEYNANTVPRTVEHMRKRREEQIKQIRQNARITPAEAEQAISTWQQAPIEPAVNNQIQMTFTETPKPTQMTEDTAIDFLKSRGYRILQPKQVFEYKEL